MSEYRTGTGQDLTGVHDEARCRDGWCAIHYPMPGPWEDWPTHWREDLGIMERICPHRVGHPVAEDWLRLPKWELVHGCCGVCPCIPNEEMWG